MNDLKKYVRDLNIVKNNLKKFYFNSASEWLKPDILDCINAVNKEIALYTRKEREKEENYKNNQFTIFDVLNEVEL